MSSRTPITRGPLIPRRIAIAIVASMTVGLVIGLSLFLTSSPADAQRSRSGAAKDRLDRTDELRRRQLPGSRVSVYLPSDFRVARSFNGFLHESGASIVLIEVAGKAFPRLARSLSARLLSSRGVLDATPLPLDRTDRFVAITGRQSTTSGWFTKVMLAIGDEQTAAMLTANVPDEGVQSALVSREDIIRGLELARLGPPALPENLPYRLRRIAPFQYAGSIAGTGDIFTEDGSMPMRATAEPIPMVVISQVAQERPNTSRGRDIAAERLMTSLRTFKDIIVQSSEAIRLNRRSAVRHTAGALTRTTNASIALYQVTVFDRGGRAFRLLGIAPADRRRQLFNVFRRMFEGFRIRGSTRPIRQGR